MILVSLNYDTRQVESMIEDFESLIWTERYVGGGDFELKTRNIAKTMDLLRLGRLVSHLGTLEMMFIEDWAVETDDEGPIMTVTGRSFETFYENRVARKGDQYHPAPLNTSSDVSDDWILTGVSAATAAQQVLAYWTTSTQSNSINLATPYISGYEVKVQTGVPTTTQNIVIQPGTVYERLLELLAIDDLGVRNERPTTIGGNFNTTIYKGNDLSSTQVLSVAAGHFRNLKYFWSIREKKTSVWGFSYYQRQHTFASTVGGYYTRIGYVDATDLKSNPTNVDANDGLTSRMAAYQAQRLKNTMIMTGELSNSFPLVYGTDYKLGDVFKAYGDYGVVQNMRVTEYTSVQDKDGERTYPALAPV